MAPPFISGTIENMMKKLGRNSEKPTTRGQRRDSGPDKHASAPDLGSSTITDVPGPQSYSPIGFSGRSASRPTTFLPLLVPSSGDRGAVAHTPSGPDTPSTADAPGSTGLPTTQDGSYSGNHMPGANNPQKSPNCQTGRRSRFTEDLPTEFTQNKLDSSAPVFGSYSTHPYPSINQHTRPLSRPTRLGPIADTQIRAEDDAPTPELQGRCSSSDRTSMAIPEPVEPLGSPPGATLSVTIPDNTSSYSLHACPQSDNHRQPNSSFSTENPRQPNGPHGPKPPKPPIGPVRRHDRHIASSRARFGSAPLVVAKESISDGQEIVYHADPGTSSADARPNPTPSDHTPASNAFSDPDLSNQSKLTLINTFFSFFGHLQRLQHRETTLRSGDLGPEPVLISDEEMTERQDFRRVIESLASATTSENVIRAVIGVVRDRIAVVEARVRVLEANEVRGRVASMVDGKLEVEDGDASDDGDDMMGWRIDVARNDW